MIKEKRIELLAPAGDLERLKYAVKYGADAVFIGGLSFSLRSMASNFTLEDIKEGCEFAHKYGSRVHVTCNIVMHNSDLEGVKEYLKELENCGVDAIIASSPTIIRCVKQYTKMEAHVSTQQSITNSKGVKFFESFGADRVVLGRECSMEQIKDIVKNSSIDIEAFIHGGMCASFSGRCMLSNILTNRDANRGGCAQSCRWDYDILDKDMKKISVDDHSFTMSSTDLNALDYIPAMIDAGVTSLKIEGRMKSLYYISNVVGTYRRVIDEYYKTHQIKDMNQYKKDMSRGENREVSHGFLAGDVTINEEIYNEVALKPNQEFVGLVKSYESETGKVTIEVRNAFDGNRDLEVMAPHLGRTRIHIGDLFDNFGNVLEGARKPQTIIYFYTEKNLDVLKGEYLLLSKTID